jgi:hypothetical protein
METTNSSAIATWELGALDSDMATVPSTIPMAASTRECGEITSRTAMVCSPLKTAPPMRAPLKTIAWSIETFRDYLLLNQLPKIIRSLLQRQQRNQLKLGRALIKTLRRLLLRTLLPN